MPGGTVRLVTMGHHTDGGCLKQCPLPFNGRFFYTQWAPHSKGRSFRMEWTPIQKGRNSQWDMAWFSFQCGLKGPSTSYVSRPLTFSIHTYTCTCTFFSSLRFFGGGYVPTYTWWRGSSTYPRWRAGGPCLGGGVTPPRLYWLCNSRWVDKPPGVAGNKKNAAKRRPSLFRYFFNVFKLQLSQWDACLVYGMPV